LFIDGMPAADFKQRWRDAMQDPTRAFGYSSASNAHLAMLSWRAACLNEASDKLSAQEREERQADPSVPPKRLLCSVSRVHTPAVGPADEVRWTDRFEIVL
jgi:hypothetical protein